VPFSVFAPFIQALWYPSCVDLGMPLIGVCQSSGASLLPPYRHEGA